MTYKTKIIKLLTDVDELNKLDYDIEVLLIKKLSIKIKIFNGNDEEELLDTLFRGVKLPVLLKHLFIENVKIVISEKSLFWDEKRFLEMFKSLSLPYDCKFDAIIEYKNNFIYFYSSDKPDELSYYKIEKNNYPLNKAYNEYLDKIKYYKNN
jgi:hypothetical protein